jgi:hypothetical protein
VAQERAGGGRSGQADNSGAPKYADYGRSDREERMAPRTNGLRRPWAAFGAWILVGGAYAVSLLGILTIGVMVLPFAIAGTVLLVRRPSTRAGLPGLIGGLGVPPLFVAYLNRTGPVSAGCVPISGGERCAGTWQSGNQVLDPWPWLLAGLLLFAIGLVVFEVTSRNLNGNR